MGGFFSLIYFIYMVSKVYISLPTSLLEELDEIARDLRANRSETIRIAIRNLIKEENVQKES